MSAYSTVLETVRNLRRLQRETSRGPNGEMDDMLAEFEAMADDLDALLGDELEPSEEEQGLTPIPRGYAEQ